MTQTKNCERCKKEFKRYQYRESKYCSMDCYLLSRWSGKVCKNCNKESKFRYCSTKCQKDYWDKNGYHIYKRQQRFLDRKLEIIKSLGGKCKNCGLDDCRVLDINHIDRSKKQRPKKQGYTWTFRLTEWKKNIKNLELLCSNCHRIHTWKQMGYGSYK